MSIEVREISKQFGGVRAVEPVSFQAREGELLALLGPSGGGKTTVLRMIAGLETPTTGDIYIAGRRVNEVPVQERNIGFVFQNYALFKNMTVFGNIAFGLRIRKWQRADLEQRVEELLEAFGLQELGRRYPHQLSGGQRQRVAIARALMNDPAVILADEPTANLDSGRGHQVVEMIARLVKEGGKAGVMVTHDERMLDLCDRVYRIADGVLSEAAKPARI